MWWKTEIKRNWHVEFEKMTFNIRKKLKGRNFAEVNCKRKSKNWWNLINYFGVNLNVVEESCVKTINMNFRIKLNMIQYLNEKYDYYWFEMISWRIKIWVCSTYEPFEELTRLNNVFRSLLCNYEALCKITKGKWDHKMNFFQMKSIDDIILTIHLNLSCYWEKEHHGLIKCIQILCDTIFLNEISMLFKNSNECAPNSMIIFLSIFWIEFLKGLSCSYVFTIGT
jgi:hypothetical protein